MQPPESSAKQLGTAAARKAVELSVLRIIGRDQNYGTDVDPADVARCASGFKHTEFANYVTHAIDASAPTDKHVRGLLQRVAPDKIFKAITASTSPPQRVKKKRRACKFGVKTLRTSQYKLWKRAWHALNPGYALLRGSFYNMLDAHTGVMKLDAVYATTQRAFTPACIDAAAQVLLNNIRVLETAHARTQS